jgi:hypothetical protein
MIDLNTKPPAGLKSAGRKLWKDETTRKVYESQAELELLRLACELSDDAAEYRAILRREGCIRRKTVGGEERADDHPAAIALRATVQTLRGCLRDLRPSAPAKSAVQPSRRRGRA